MNYKSLPSQNGKNNMGGFTSNAFIAPISAFDVIKPLKSTTLPGDSVTIDGSHTFAVDEGFSKVYATLDKSKIDMTLVGDRDGKSFLIKGEIFHPGTEKDAAEFAAAAKNDNFIMIFKESNGKNLQFGSADLPLIVNPSYSSANIGSGAKGWKFEFEAWTNQMQFYEGTITIKA